MLAGRLALLRRLRSWVGPGQTRSLSSSASPPPPSLARPFKVSVVPFELPAAVLRAEIEHSRQATKLGKAIFSLVDKLLRWTNVGLNLSTVSEAVSVESMQPVYLPYWVSHAVLVGQAWPQRCLC